MNKQEPINNKQRLPLGPPPPEAGCCGETRATHKFIGRDWRIMGIPRKADSASDGVLHIPITPNGDLRLPEALKERWAITGDNELLLKETREGLMIWPAAPPLAKVYIEPTTACNYHCRTCVRNAWEEKTGFMAFETFKKLMADLENVKTLKEIAFWGIGEPLLHPDIIRMIKLAHDLGVKTELITNGALLDKDMAHNIILAGLDTLVASVDGVSSDTYAEIRCGGDFDKVTENIIGLQRAQWELNRSNPEVGIEFVIMQRNIDQLPKLWQTAFYLGASFIILSNVLPYTEDMKEEILYKQSARMDNDIHRSMWSPEVILPRIDMHSEYMAPIADLIYLTGRPKIGLKEHAASDEGHCPFIWQGSAAVSWTGDVSPCIALMHAYRCFVLEREKVIKPYLTGNVAREKITDIWNKEDFKAFRNRVRNFDFPPCIDCGGCDFADSNEEDCFGNPHPVCGDCLWARRVIVCP
ncbi:MAG: radical SAM protein [Deltaproteobacteria bacterium]|nr:radical SAM protein [Deltaproteobacteria bacterium]